MTGICYNSELTDPVQQLRGAADPAGPQGQGRAATEMRDTMSFMLLMVGSDPDDFTAGRVRRRDRQAAGGRRERSGPALRRQRLHRRHEVRQHRGLRGVERRRHQPARRRQVQVVPPEEGFAIWTDNMLVPNKADAQDERRDDDELLLRPGDRREAVRLGLLLLSGRRAPRRRSSSSTSPLPTASSSSSTTRPRSPATCSCRSTRRRGARLPAPVQRGHEWLTARTSTWRASPSGSAAFVAVDDLT